VVFEGIPQPVPRILTVGMLQFHLGVIQSVVELRLRAVCVWPSGRDTVIVCRYSALYGYAAALYTGGLN